jgi:hypothetical protein
MTPRPRQSTPSVFTIDQARQHGITDHHLYRTGLLTPFSGIRVEKATKVSTVVLAQQLAFRDPTLVISHQTAAQAWGLWLPARIRRPGIHLSRIRGTGTAPRFKDAEGHLISADSEDLRTVDGVRLTSPEWTWTDLASQGLTLNELVAAGDALLQRNDGPPRPPGLLGRNPLSTPEAIRNLLERRRGVRGLRDLRTAVELLRARVDSEPESRIRTGLVDSGWPEPDVNPRIVFPDGWKITADLVYWAWRIVLQYEGKHHFSEESQYRRDMRRDRELARRGWATVRMDGDVFDSPRKWTAFLDQLAAEVERQTLLMSQTGESEPTLPRPDRVHS